MVIMALSLLLMK